MSPSFVLIGRFSPVLLGSVVWLISSWMAPPAFSAETQVAVAANFTAPAREIAESFEAENRHRAVLSTGSTGALFAQIAHGAPFEVFLAADVDRPRRAEAAGLAVVGSRFTYAVGRLVLYSPDIALVPPGGGLPEHGLFQKLAIANPGTAPYGAAAMEVLTALGQSETLRARLVRGTSVGQAFQFVVSGAAELGFVARAQTAQRKTGSHWLVPSDLHTPIRQQAVLLQRGKNRVAAKAFHLYLRSQTAREIIRRYGYDIE